MNFNRLVRVNKFNKKQQEAIRLLALKELEGLTLEEIALRVGVDRPYITGRKKKILKGL